ncbi:polyprotein [Bienertia sinuspersici]
MSYRSKRTISNLATDASKRQKKPTPPLVSQSSTAANTATPPPPPNEANDTSESKKLIKQLPPKGTHTSPQMPSFSSKAPIKWGPFCPPGNGVPTTLSPSFGTDGVAGMNPIWKTHPETFNSNPQATKPLGSSIDDGKQSSIKTKSTTSKSETIFSNKNIGGNQLPIGSSTTTFSRDNNDRIAVKPPDHVQQERIRLTAQLQHQKNSVMLHQRHENSRDTINMQQEGGGKATYMQQEMQESSRRTTNMQQQGSDQTRDKSNNSKTFKTRLSFKIDGWPTEVEYDAKEEVLTLLLVLLVAAGCCWFCWLLLLAAVVVSKLKQILVLLVVLLAADASYFLAAVATCYWLLKLSQIGKEARSLQFQAHTMGSNSYANLRADYEAEHGKKMGLVEAWEKSHMRKDGSFVAGTITEDFLSDAKAKVDLLKLNNSSSSSVDVEDEAFHSLMNGGDIPERPQGFGFGVKKSDVYGVRGILRKQGSRKVKIRDLDVNASVSNTNKTNEVLKKENRELSMKNDENTRTLKTVLTQFSQILDTVRKGKASVELIDAAQSALHMAIPESRSCQQQQCVMVVRVCADQKLL